ncbi:S-methyl-5-thioribose-1-phosphate isomerase [Candidatus Bathyarchaeota archaeon RBG_16_57_9]|nr:MAG: S-methyl-5-thioribose-1-phosphate isomerase [Candidatus Bathyarchaeota archaeon RBG_16_57_9]
MRVKVGGETRDVLALWREGSTVKMIDQRLLPHRFEIISLASHVETAAAIRDMATRGAGAVGCAAGYALAQAALEASGFTPEKFEGYIAGAAETVRGTRPTAVNLFHAVDRCLAAAGDGPVAERGRNMVEAADGIAADDREASRLIGLHGAGLIRDGFRVLTHCNAGALGFLDDGTALSPIRVAHRQGRRVFVWVDETRPRCQGARLTAWEMEMEGLPYALIVDNAAGHFMRRGEVDLVIVGADRVAANGDVANKVGTYEKAVVARENGVPFYVAAPGTTFDQRTPTGNGIDIEERTPEEVTRVWGLDREGEYRWVQVPMEGTPARNPSFDVTPARYVTGFITEKGIVKPPYASSIRKTFRT